MERDKKNRQNMKLFWSKNKERCQLIRSIDTVYEEYLTYLKNEGIDDRINKYIFRTYIRKNGYNNSGVEMKIKQKNVKKKKIKQTNTEILKQH